MEHLEARGFKRLLGARGREDVLRVKTGVRERRPGSSQSSAIKTDFNVFG